MTKEDNKKYLITLKSFTEEIESTNRDKTNDFIVDRLMLTYNTIASRNRWDSQMTVTALENND